MLFQNRDFMTLYREVSLFIGEQQTRFSPVSPCNLLTFVVVTHLPKADLRRTDYGILLLPGVSRRLLLILAFTSLALRRRVRILNSLFGIFGTIDGCMQRDQVGIYIMSLRAKFTGVHYYKLLSLLTDTLGFGFSQCFLKKISFDAGFGIPLPRAAVEATTHL